MLRVARGVVISPWLVSDVMLSSLRWWLKKRRRRARPIPSGAVYSSLSLRRALGHAVAATHQCRAYRRRRSRVPGRFTTYKVKYGEKACIPGQLAIFRRVYSARWQACSRAPALHNDFGNLSASRARAHLSREPCALTVARAAGSWPMRMPMREPA